LPHDPYAALRYPPFRWFVVSLFAMTLGTQTQAVVVGWQMYALTHDPLALGLIGLAEALPYIGLALFAGHVADAGNRRRIAIVALIALLACSVALLVFTVTPGFLTRHGVWPVYAAIFASGIARSFLQPARQALGAELIPRELYVNGAAWRTSTWQTAAVGGPALGGLLYGFSGAGAAYVVIVTLIAISVLAFTRVAYEPRVLDAIPVTVGEGLRSGIRFVFSQPILLGALTLDLFSVFLAGSEALLPVFASEILHVGPQGLGILRAAPAAGAVVMSLYLAHRRPIERAGLTMILAVAVFAVCIIGFGLSRSFWLSLILLAVSGMADNVSVVIRSTLLQLMTPLELLGRVSSVNAIFVGSSNELGAFESGVAARLLGTVTAVVAGGVASLAVVGIVATRVPELRRLRKIG
jgi:MFS family permease